MDEETMVQVYRECVHPLYGYVARRCGSDRTLAEDVTQETWLRAVTAWKEDGMPDHPLPWLRTVARNLILNHFRRASPVSLEGLPGDWEGKYLAPGADVGQSADPPGSPGNDGTPAATLNWGLARMKPGQARLLEAFHLDGRSVRDIAHELEVSERAVEGRLRRARANLQKKLEPLVRREGGPR